MKTVIESQEFISRVSKIFNDEERENFITYIAENPLAGDVIPESDGLRKVRWAAKGKGKRGGARVIYYNIDSEGVVVLITVYAKNKTANIPGHKLKR